MPLTPSILTAIFALACAVSLIRLTLVHRHDGAAGAMVDSREADAAHVVMNGAMAAMPFAALHGWSGAALWLLAAALGARFAYVAAARPKGAPGKRPVLTATAYHLFTVLAMIYAMQQIGHSPVTIADHAAMGHPAGHGDHPAPGWIAMALGGFFLIDGFLTLGVGLFAPSFAARTVQEAAHAPGEAVAGPPTVSRSSFFFAAFGHVVMDFGMAGMLLLPH